MHERFFYAYLFLLFYFSSYFDLPPLRNYKLKMSLWGSRSKAAEVSWLQSLTQKTFSVLSFCKHQEVGSWGIWTPWQPLASNVLDQLLLERLCIVHTYGHAPWKISPGRNKKINRHAWTTQFETQLLTKCKYFQKVNTRGALGRLCHPLQQTFQDMIFKNQKGVTFFKFVKNICWVTI